MNILFSIRYWLLAAILFLLGGSVWAITLVEVTSPTFGLIFSGASGRQFVLNTSGTITGANAADQLSGQTAGDITVTDSTAPVTLAILVDSIVAMGGLTVNQVLCSYNGGAQTRCDGAPMNVTSAASASLKVGIDLTTLQVHSGGDSASVSMTINVNFL